eukprot:scaffold1070_cov245-Pinguiococcus_pyrenoidosus.AAC.36
MREGKQLKKACITLRRCSARTCCSLASNLRAFRPSARSTGTEARQSDTALRSVLVDAIP